MSEITVQRAIEIALQHQQAGRTAEAETLFRQLQDVVGDNPIALQGLGKEATEAGLAETALRLYRRAVALQPGMASAHNGIGLLLRAEGSDAEALEAFQRASAADPKNLEYLYNVSSTLRSLGRIEQAIEFARRMIALSPGFSAGYFELGRSLQQGGQLAEAIESYRRALQFQPDLAPAWHQIGTAMGAEKRFGEAIDALGRAAALQPHDAGIQVDLGHAFYELGRYRDGAEAFTKSISLRLHQPNLLYRPKDVLFDTGMYGAAIACFQRVIEMEPNSVWARCNLAWIVLELGMVNEAMALQKQTLQLEPDNSIVYDNLLNTMRLSDSVGDEELVQAHRAWGERFADPLFGQIPVHRNDRSPERVVRIGYVSPDLRSHPVGIFMLHILQAHDRRQFHITCYSNTATDDLMSRRLRDAVDGWYIIEDWSDERVAAQVVEDRIDILIDLTQHTAGHRLLVFARKPAPMQVTYLGCPGTTGLKTFDAQISDPYLDPPGKTEHLSTEPIERLPQTYWCFRPIADAPPLQPPPAVIAGLVTFGCLNRIEKSSPAAMRLWSAILRRVPQSRLILIAPAGSHRQRIIDIFKAEGIDPQRIELISKQPVRDYFELYNRIDIALDPFPYNGGTTTCQAMWMGVPVVTLAGTSAVQRSGVSLLSNVGLQELIAPTPEQYVQIAADLAGDLPRLAALRQSLRDRMAASPLMDLSQFVGNLEAIYRKLWRQWCSR